MMEIWKRYPNIIYIMEFMGKFHWLVWMLFSAVFNHIISSEEWYLWLFCLYEYFNWISQNYIVTFINGTLTSRWIKVKYIKVVCLRVSSLLFYFYTLYSKYTLLYIIVMYCLVLYSTSLSRLCLVCNNIHNPVHLCPL